MNVSRIALFCLPLISLSSYGEFKNNSYSYLGLGIEEISYSETADNFGGQTFKSDFQGKNIVQKSGGYTAIGDQYGFFISTSSTLLTEEANEKWEFGNIGVVQEDTMTLKRTGIDLLGAYHLLNGHFFNAGLHYGSVSFSRFDFTSTDNTEKLNEALFANPEVQTNLQNNLINHLQIINDLRASGSTTCIRDSSKDNECIGTIDPVTNEQAATLEEYWEATKFAPDQTEGVVFEQMISWSGLIGWGYDSYFVDQSLGIRYKFAARMGASLYENILNTNNNVTLIRTLGGDWDTHLLAGVGYQFQKEIGILFTLELNASHRSKLKVTGQDAFLPDNTMFALSPQIAGFWSF